MPNSPGYKALLIRTDARQAIDEAKKVYAKTEGIDLNYSQFILYLCKNFLSDSKKSKPQ